MSGEPSVRAAGRFFDYLSGIDSGNDQWLIPQ